MNLARRGGAAKRTLGSLGLGGLAVLAFIALLQYYSESGFTPLELQCPPVFTRGEAGDRIYLLTGQWPTYRSAGRSQALVFRSRHLVDLWAIDAADARPVWRKRLTTDRDGGVHDRSLLGVHRDTLWLSFQERLIALSAADGSVKANPERLEALNPELKGRMPTDPQYFTFDEHGLHVTTTDARTWLLDPDTLKAFPDAAEGPSLDGAFAPVVYLYAGTWNYLSRGLDTPGHWVGLLTEEEAVAFEKNNALGGLTRDVARRLWSARSLPARDSFGALPDYYEVNLLPGGAEYLDGGLLGEHNVMEPPPPFKLSAPDSVLVLHREHLGETGKLRMARVATQDGNTVWEAALPLTVVQSVMPAEGTVVLFGTEYIEADPKSRDLTRDAPQRLVSVDLASGAVHVHSHTDFETHPEAEEVDLGF